MMDWFVQYFIYVVEKEKGAIDRRLAPTLAVYIGYIMADNTVIHWMVFNVNFSSISAILLCMTQW